MIEIHRLGARIGAEIRGVDVKALDDADFAAIYRAWLDANVLVVPGQDLQIEDFLRYSRRFGVVHPHPSKMTRHPDHPEITLLGVDKFRPDGALDMAVYRRGAEGWHTDGAYDQEPFKATQLYALAVPSTGGDTLFASMYAAYDALPPRLAQRLDGRNGAFTYGGRRKATALLNAEDRDWTPVFHPIIRTHPETGRKALYFDPGKILRIEGLDESESDALIEELTARMIQPDAQYRHRWRKGDIVIWDNRCSYHKAAGDYPPEEDRIHWRVSIKDAGSKAAIVREVFCPSASLAPLGSRLNVLQRLRLRLRGSPRRSPRTRIWTSLGRLGVLQYSFRASDSPRLPLRTPGRGLSPILVHLHRRLLSARPRALGSWTLLSPLRRLAWLG